jgi:MerR family redox-sensitive transcriptional activator SoxR
LRDQVGDCIGCGCVSLKSCPLRNQSDVLAQEGPGYGRIRNGYAPSRAARLTTASAAMAEELPDKVGVT